MYAIALKIGHLIFLKKNPMLIEDNIKHNIKYSWNKHIQFLTNFEGYYDMYEIEY